MFLMPDFNHKNNKFSASKDKLSLADIFQSSEQRVEQHFEDIVELKRRDKDLFIDV